MWWGKSVLVAAMAGVWFAGPVFGEDIVLPEIVVSAVSPELPVSATAENPIVIDTDDGGNVDQHLKWYKRLFDSGTPTRLRGVCISACTIVLILPPSQVCIEPTSTLGFHIFTIDGVPLTGYTAAFMRRYYPKPVQDWLVEWEARNGKMTVAKMAYMPAADVVRLGVFPACDGAK